MKATVFFNNRSQAVRLPKAIALPDNIKHVEIIAIGKSRIIAPVDNVWDDWFSGDAVTSDFMNEREQPGNL